MILPKKNNNENNEARYSSLQTCPGPVGRCLREETYLQSVLDPRS